MSFSNVQNFHLFTDGSIVVLIFFDGSNESLNIYTIVSAEIYCSSEILPAFLCCGFNMDNVSACFNLVICL